MNFEVLTPAEIAPEEALHSLQKMRERAKQKWMIIFLTIGLLVLGSSVVYALEIKWLLIAYAASCIASVFIVGAWVFLKLPVLTEVEHKYAQVVLPGLFTKTGATEVRVGKHHDLSMKTFLEAGLYHDKYSSISREDYIQGKFNERPFGMYEIAIQTVATYGGGGAQNTVGTNRFYGWFIIVPADRISGFHFITMRYRNNNGESDDWHTLTLQHWEEDVHLQKFVPGESKFDDAFLLNTNQPEALHEILTPSLQEFLLYAAATAKNSFAISIQRSRIYVMIGHERANFRQCPEKKFTEEFHPDLLEDVKWYADLLKGIHKVGSR
ncbi:MAG TPA: DUF3137 domain-containing protein [Bacteroidia bacterium]|nr:DUF3137 domain-containing protein [Bacteroidia bacterium]